MDEGTIKLYGLVERYRLELSKRYGLAMGGLDVNLGGSTICGIHEIVLISKKFGFVQWLIENDKIDLEKIKEWNYINLDASLFSQTNMVLIFLSIQENPISFLISILK